jgi:hypothetical protein
MSEETITRELEQQQLLPVKCRECDRHFRNQWAANVHYARTHTKGWDTSKNFKRNTLEKKRAERRENQKRQRNRNFAKGLNSKGWPYKRPWAWNSKAGKNSLTAETQPAQTPTDNMAESARAIIVAAQVLRAVSLGIKL